MPIYQYQCSDCGHRMEALQKMSDAKLTDCPACDTPNLKKQLTAAAFKLKGTGWYETDFKNSGQPAKAADSGANDASAASADSKTAATTSSTTAEA